MVLDVNTDSVSCIFDGDVLPFKLDGINLKKHYWDKDKLVPKYKIENKDRLKCSGLPYRIRTEKYVPDINYSWNITRDVKDNDLKPLVDKIIKSDDSYFIAGPGGAGKSTLINEIKQKIREMSGDDDEDDKDEAPATDSTKQKTN
jgi:hypothetical protein